MQTLSSITITPAEPSMLPLAASVSKSIGRSAHSAAVMTAADDPPGITALSLRVGTSMPPHCSEMSVMSGMPSSASYTPGFLRCPDMQNSFGPEFFSLPMLMNQSAPRSTMKGTQHSVSTLLMVVGLP